ncbi:hypothetical protein GmRootV118_23070 [Variovorax sp. V118]|uniref:hypothetical protein n=1 Tax=Variovorax sp. V118 TaxID=3065954 RepID=UPI0034E8F68F
MALTRKNAKPGKGMQYELDLVGAIGRTKVPPIFLGVVCAGMFSSPRGVWRHGCIEPLIHVRPLVLGERRA